MREKVFCGAWFLVSFCGGEFIFWISSAIIEDIKSTQDTRPALIAYYYFDAKDPFKRDVRGLLASLLSQLAGGDSRCWDILDGLYTLCRNGSEQPSDAALAGRLISMLNLLRQSPTFLIIDALDECQNTAGSPSAREEVLNLLKDLVQSSHSNLFICVTCRPEQDIQTVFNPFTSAFQVILHEEGGQRDDIKKFVRSFVHEDKNMRTWGEEDREFVTTTIPERAGGM